MTAALGNTSQGTPFATGIDAFVYPQFIGNALRAPSTRDIQNPGTRWQDNSVNPSVIYETTGAGIWYQITGVSGGISSVHGTGNQINSATVGQSVTLSIPTIFIAPGSIASTTTLTGGNGIIANAGNITASSGNVAASGSVSAGTGVSVTTGNVTFGQLGAGIQMVSATGSGSSAGPVSCNGRSGAVTFTGVNIAGFSSVVLTMGNSSIKDASTIVLYSISGVTTGAALNINSITNSANSSAILISNATGATTQTDDITLTFIVLN